MSKTGIIIILKEIAPLPNAGYGRSWGRTHLGEAPKSEGTIAFLPHAGYGPAWRDSTRIDIIKLINVSKNFFFQIAYKITVSSLE